MDHLNEKLMDTLQRTYMWIQLRQARGVLKSAEQEQDHHDYTLRTRGSSMDKKKILQLREQHSTLQREQILREIRWEGHPVSQKKLADRFSIRPQSMSESITKLEQDGYVTRTRNKDDRREVLVSLTKKGEERADALDTIKAQQSAEFLKPLTEEEKQTLLRLLDKLNLVEELGLADEI